MDLVLTLKVLIQHLQERKASVEITDDYYWEIDEQQLYDPTKNPSAFGMGQPSEDWQRLSRIMSGAEPPIGYGLVWLASILRAVGQKNVP